MCGMCGCSEDVQDKKHHKNHTHDTFIAHHHGSELTEMVRIEQDILAKNNQFARKNKHFFHEKKILTVNMMSSPGSGKTTLLAKTISDMKDKITSAVIVGDQQTDHDAALLRACGTEAVQINTGKICHLDAHMIDHALEQLPTKERMILFIENIGNLVCPALFHLGEDYKIVILSVTEGDNKPLKYPEMFRSADLMILTKIDLLPYVKFDVDKCCEYARKIKPDLEILMLSAAQGHGLTQWYQWLTQKQRVYMTGSEPLVNHVET